MKAWDVSADIQADATLSGRVESYRPVVEEVLGQSAPLVEARWSVVASGGERRFILTLSDWTYPAGVEATFGMDALPTTFDTRWKIHRLWGDLLQARNHQQLDELLEAGA